jgi:hypothetical protein
MKNILKEIKELYPTPLWIANIVVISIALLVIIFV